MSYHIGPKQLDILRAIRDGQELWMQSRHWQLDGVAVNRERCITLYQRGFLMNGKTEDLPGGKWRQKYELTDKGRWA